MGTIGERATERVYATDGNGTRRLIAAPGDPIPTTLPALGIVTPPEDADVHIVPFDGYDALDEAAIVARLPELDAETLRHVQAYEAARQARGAITRFGKTSRAVRGGGKPAAVVPAESTSTGYDSLDDDALAAELTKRGLTAPTTGGAAKVRKARIAALQADDAKTDE